MAEQSTNIVKRYPILELTYVADERLLKIVKVGCQRKETASKNLGSDCSMHKHRRRTTFL